MAREVQRAVRPPRPSSIRTSLFLLLFTNVQNYKNNAYAVARCQGALIFQEKAIFRKDLLNNALESYPLVKSSMEREMRLHQRERRMASLLARHGLIVRPVRATVPLHFL